MVLVKTAFGTIKLEVTPNIIPMLKLLAVYAPDLKIEGYIGLSPIHLSLRQFDFGEQPKLRLVDDP